MDNIIYLGLGTNIGDRVENFKNALESLSPAVKIKARSSIYQTPPWGFEDQAEFLNMVVQAQTMLEPEHLLKHIKEIEVQLGRTPTFRNGPRLIDIDILFYKDLVLDTPDLTIPHPRVHERSFMLVPLNDIASDLQHPIKKQTITQLLETVDTSGVNLFKEE